MMGIEKDLEMLHCYLKRWRKEPQAKECRECIIHGMQHITEFEGSYFIMSS